MRTEFMLLALYNKPRLSFSEVCSAIGIAEPTGYSWRSLHKFPIKLSGSPMSADIRDVAEYLDQLRLAAS